MHQQQEQQQQALTKFSTAKESVLEHLLSQDDDHALRCPCYCEENVWRIAYKKLQQSNSSSKYYAVFISNPQQCIPMFRQTAATERCCYWDYHVILIEQRQTQEAPTLVYDVDTTLTPYPMELSKYLDLSFPTIVAQQSHSESKNRSDSYISMHHYIPYFRVIQIEDYLQYFSSDRRHMYDSVTKEWNAPPPTYQPVVRGASNESSDYDDLRVHSLSKYIDFTTVGEDDSSCNQMYGDIVDFHEFHSF